MVLQRLLDQDLEGIAARTRCGAECASKSIADVRVVTQDTTDDVDSVVLFRGLLLPVRIG